MSSSALFWNMYRSIKNFPLGILSLYTLNVIGMLENTITDMSLIGKNVQNSFKCNIIEQRNCKIAT